MRNYATKLKAILSFQDQLVRWFAPGHFLTKGFFEGWHVPLR